MSIQEIKSKANEKLKQGKKLGKENLLANIILLGISIVLYGIVIGIGIINVKIALILSFIASIIIYCIKTNVNYNFLVSVKNVANEKKEYKSHEQAFKFGYHIFINTVLNIKILLWSLLLIIPGIIASFNYALTMFYRAENEEWTTEECIAESKRIIKGNRVKFLILQLHNIGYYLITMIPIIGLFVGEYISSPKIVMCNYIFYESIKNSKGEIPKKKNNKDAIWSVAIIIMLIGGLAGTIITKIPTINTKIVTQILKLDFPKFEVKKKKEIVEKNDYSIKKVIINEKEISEILIDYLTNDYLFEKIDYANAENETNVIIAVKKKEKPIIKVSKDLSEYLDTDIINGVIENTVETNKNTEEQKDFIIEQIESILRSKIKIKDKGIQPVIFSYIDGDDEVNYWGVFNETLVSTPSELKIGWVIDENGLWYRTSADEEVVNKKIGQGYAIIYNNDENKYMAYYFDENGYWDMDAKAQDTVAAILEAKRNPLILSQDGTIYYTNLEESEKLFEKNTAIEADAAFRTLLGANEEMVKIKNDRDTINKDIKNKVEEVEEATKSELKEATKSDIPKATKSVM